jgi:D-aminoacyl-tRNA deacylase
VHPVGNWGGADYGGTPGAVSGTAPGWMTGLLLAIARTAPAGYQACFEATHHGPLLETPAFFVEIGSDESRWELREPAEVLARALLALEPASGIALIGIGGGHYTPRFSDVALQREAVFGHMVPKYALEQLTPELLRSALERSGARAIYLHRKGMPKSAVTRWRDWAGKNSIAIVSSKELPQREK